MAYTYPQALTALESIANDYIKTLRPHDNAPVRLICDAYATTASVTWDHYGVRVNMPVRPAMSVMTQTEFEDWVAYMLHELGHPTHTDQSAWQDAVCKGVSRMVNALEDVRMEQALIASGIVPNARKVLSRLVSRKVAEARANDWKPNSRREFAWTVCVLGRAANGYDIPASDLAWIKSQIKAGSTVETVLGWTMPALAACKSTADCVALAERIAKALATPQGEQGEADINTRKGKGEGDGEASEGDGEASEGDGEGEGENGTGEASEGDGEASEGEGEGKGEGEQDEQPKKGEQGEGGEGRKRRARPWRWNNGRGRKTRNR